MNQYKDHFTPRMFHRLLAPSLAYSLGLAFAAMADAIVIGWQMGVTGLAADEDQAVQLLHQALDQGFAQKFGQGEQNVTVDVDLPV